MPYSCLRIRFLLLIALTSLVEAHPAPQLPLNRARVIPVGLQRKEGDGEGKPDTSNGVKVTPVADLLLVSAVYGTWTEYADVTKRVTELLGQEGIIFTATPGALRADPKPGWNKALVIIYEFEGQRALFTAGEGAKVSVPLLRENARKAALKNAKPGPPREDLK